MIKKFPLEDQFASSKEVFFLKMAKFLDKSSSD